MVGKVLTGRLLAGRAYLTESTPYGRYLPTLDEVNDRPGREARAGFFVSLVRGQATEAINDRQQDQQDRENTSRQEHD